MITRTFSGLDMNLEAPAPAMVRMADIAHHLATINRYAGAASFPISVAQHCLIVERILGQMKAGPLIQLVGLLHDAHEAYLGDVVRPVKSLLARKPFPAGLETIEAAVDGAIHSRFRISWPARQAAFERIAEADDIALATEWRAAMKGPCPVAAAPANFNVRFMSWPDAEAKFADAFRRLAIAAGIEPDPDGRSP